MTDYRRARVPGATWFFTLGLAERPGNGLLVERLDALGSAFRAVRQRHPFHMEAVVVLPDHLHCVWSLPDGDADYSMRWGLIKAHFSRGVERGERRSASRIERGERGIWQRRFWEHCLRDEGDYASRGLHPLEPCETRLRATGGRLAAFHFHRHVARGVYPVEWDGGEPGGIAAGE